MAAAISPFEGRAWKKALSDVRLTNTRFSFQIVIYLLVTQKENLTLHQLSLRALIRAPLHHLTHQ